MTRALTGALGVAAIAAVAACAEPTPSGSIHGPAGATVLDRPDSPGTSLQFHFDEGDDVETFGSPGGRFVVHFTRAGDHAVPAADEDASGTPDFVEEVAETYDEVLSAYEGLGFRAPLDDGDVADNGGDDRFDVYLVDFNGVGDGAFRVDACLPDAPDRCAGFMTQENDFVGYGYPTTRVANRILASHELFHAVQAAYDRDQGSVFAEGTAVWATETFAPQLEDFEAFLPGYFENPDRPLDEPLPGPVDPFSYGAAIFFEFLTEAYGDTVVRALWESVEDGAGGVDDPYWLGTLDGVLEAEGGVSFAEAYVRFARWNLATDDFADPDESYADGADYPRVKIESETAPFVDESFRTYRASASYVAVAPGGRSEMTAAVVAPADDPTATDGIEIILAAETDDGIESNVLSAPTSGTESVDLSVVNRVVVVVVNTATTGDSKKPGLCIGDLAEVASCKAAIEEGGSGGGSAESTGTGTGTGPTTASATTAQVASVGAGPTSSSSGTGDGSGGGDGSSAEDGSDDGCGCAAPGSTAPASRAWIGALAIAAYANRRRFRRARRPSASSEA